MASVAPAAPAETTEQVARVAAALAGGILGPEHDPAVPERIIAAMQRRPLAEIAAEPWVAAPLGPILERHRSNVEVVRRHARVDGGVV